MNFNWLLDGSIVGVYLLATMIAGLMVRKYVARVDHFLVAGREMNVYLGIASLAATEFGIVTAMYTAQAGYTRGFAGAIPGVCNAVAMFVVGYTGFCVKPLRDSGVMTIPELFERRYGKLVRWLAGVVIVLGGLLNMGVFLRVGGQFLVVCCGMNLRYLELAMTVLLVGVAVYTILGGMLSVLVTDFLQFVVMSVGLLVVTFLVLHHVGWDKLVATVQTHQGDGGFNPFIPKDLGWPFVLSNLLTNTAAVLTWQAVIARLLAARDSDTGRKVYTGTAFFFICRWVIPAIWGIAALAMIEPSVVEKIGLQFGEKDGSLFAMPYLLSQIVPAGMMGLLVAAMLAADMSTDSSYMLTWGSVIYNDILAPFRKVAWSEKKGLLWNRCIIALIGVFLLIWGLWYKLEGNLWEYLQTTGTIYLASMTVLLVACCYWKRANNWGAIAAIVVGAALPVLALSLDLFVKVPALDAAGQALIKDGKAVTEGWAAHHLGSHFVNIGTFAAVALAMVVGSLLKPRSSRREGQIP